MSTKRKIEDYKDQKVAIYCSTKEEWDKIVDLFDKPSVKKEYWVNFINLGKSDTINITGRGWRPKKHYEDNGYTIYPASDFLEKESVNSLLENEIYYNLTSNNIVRWKNSTGGNYLGNGCTIYKSDYGGNFHNNVKQYRLATPEEKHWFLECEKADRFIPYDKAMETFEKSFKFNIGDEIKAKPGGYYIADPEFFAESHKKQFPSEKSRISGKITERTQAQGFNWYRCGNDNWITEEGAELIKENIPEDDLISEAKRRYPIGTKFIDLVNNIQFTVKSHNFENFGKETQLYITVEINPKGNKTARIYHEGKWAEIVSDEPEINTYDLKVGDTLKQEIINAWADIEGNFCPDVQRGWVDTFCRYGEDRKIEDFRDIDGQIGFHVSGCTKGTHYLKAEGFKEFADNFYKKKEEGMLVFGKYKVGDVVVSLEQKAPYRVVGDMFEVLKSNIDALYYLHNTCSLASKEWRAATEEEIKAFQQGIKNVNDIPKECYPSNEIIIPQVIKSSKKQFKKITIESPTELDLKLKTIKPKQIQTIKI